MSTKQQFSLGSFLWRYFPISKPSYTAIISLSTELTDIFSKYILELMPEYEVLVINMKEKIEDLHKFQDKKIYVFDFRKIPGKFPSWEDIDKFDEIKFKLFLFDEDMKRIPGALLTRSDLILLEELKDYMSMFFSGISFTVDREVVAYIIDKSEMMPLYYFFDTQLMARTFRLKVTVERDLKSHNV